MKSVFTNFQLVVWLAAMAVMQVLGNPFRAQFAKQLEGYQCNIEFKKTYMFLDYEHMDRKPGDPSKKIKAFCPRIIFSCCSDKEFDGLIEGIKSPLRELTTYYVDIRKEMEFLTDFESSSVKTFYVTQARKNKSGKCTLEEDDEILDSSFIQSESAKITKMVDKTVKNIVKFYGGFACSMCDATDLKNISINPSTSHMRMKIDANVCETLFKFSSDQYEITEFALRVFKLTEALNCNKGDSNNKLKSLLDEFQLKMSKYQNSLKKCKLKNTLANDILPDEKCQDLCKKLFNFKEWIDYYSILGLVSYIKIFLTDFATQEKKSGIEDMVLTDLSAFLDNFMGDGLVENKFHIYNGQVKSVYDDSYEVELDNIEGINPFDHNPAISYKDDELIL
jgi:hypothetical protein